MKHKLMLLLTALGLTLSAVTFSGISAQANNASCPLAGTPMCPPYPGCCK